MNPEVALGVIGEILQLRLEQFARVVQPFERIFRAHGADGRVRALLEALLRGLLDAPTPARHALEVFGREAVLGGVDEPTAVAGLAGAPRTVEAAGDGRKES